MLGYMRKNAGSWIIKVLFVIIVIVFVFFYGFNQGGEKEFEYIASVGEKKISMVEYKKAYSNLLQVYKNLYKTTLSEKRIEQLGLKQKALENLINQELFIREAESLNLKVSSDEVKKSIMATKTFHENGMFSPRLYKRILEYYVISAKDFEEDQQKQLLTGKLKNLINNAVVVSDAEVRQIYDIEKENRVVEYVNIKPGTIKDDFKIDQQEVKKYYDANREDFKIPEQARVKYVIFDPANFEEKIEVSDSEVKEYYDQDSEQFYEPEKVRARHILFKLKKDVSKEEEDKLREKALSVLAKLKKGSSFEKMAEKYSEDSSTAKKGGDLGYFKKGQMVKPFEEAAFSMKKGETSELVRSQYGIHIILVEDNNPAYILPLEEVREKIVKEIKLEQAQEMARKTAKRSFNRLFRSKDLQTYADQNGLEMVETDYFVFGKAPEDIPGKESFSKETFVLTSGELAPAFVIGQKYFLVKLVDKLDSHIADIKKVTQDIEKILNDF